MLKFLGVVGFSLGFGYLVYVNAVNHENDKREARRLCQKGSQVHCIEYQDMLAQERVVWDD